MALKIYDETIQMCREMALVVRQIERRDGDLARQLRRAASSVVLNLAEGEHSSDGHRRERFRTARGSVGEARAGVDAAEAFGLIGPLGEVERARWHTAMGSAAEVRAILDVALAFELVSSVDPLARDRLDKIVATLFRLTR